MEETEARQRKCEICKRRINTANYEIHLTKCKAKPPKPSRKEAREAKKRAEEAARAEREAQQPQEPEERFPCYNCGFMQTLAQLDTHPRGCPNQDRPCQYCRQRYPFNIMISHLEVCERRPQRPPSPPLPAFLASNADPPSRSESAQSSRAVQPSRPPASNPPSDNSRSQSVANAVRIQPFPHSRHAVVSRSESVENQPRREAQEANRSEANPPRQLPRVNIFTGNVEHSPPPNIFVVNRNERESNGSARSPPPPRANQSQNDRPRARRNISSAIDLAAHQQRANFVVQNMLAHSRQLVQELAARQMSKKEQGMPREMIQLIPEKLFQPRGCEEEEEMCAICCTEFEGKDYVKDLKCKHDFHSKCISDWLSINSSCPLCKTDLSVNVRLPQAKPHKIAKKSFMIPVTQEDLDAAYRQALADSDDEG